MAAGLTDLLQQGREELIAVGIDVHLIIFERQGEVLVSVSSTGSYSVR